MNKKVENCYKELASGEVFDVKPFLSGVVDIVYHETQGEGDAHYCDIFMDDGRIKRIFRPDYIEFAK